MALLQHLQEATIFSKFDLKSGFWQLGVHPEERILGLMIVVWALVSMNAMARTGSSFHSVSKKMMWSFRLLLGCWLACLCLRRIKEGIDN